MKSCITILFSVVLVGSLLVTGGCSGKPGDNADADSQTQTDDGQTPIDEPPKRTPRPANNLDIRFVNLRIHSAIIFHSDRIRRNEVYNNRLVSSIAEYSEWVEQFPAKYAMLLSEAKGNAPAGLASTSLWLFKFEQTFDASAWMKEKFTEIEEKKAAQKKYFTGKRGEITLAMYTPDDKTVLLGPTAKIISIVTSPPTTPQFADRLQHIDCDHDICFLFDTRQASNFPQLACEWFTADEKSLIDSAAAKTDWIEGGVDLGGDPIMTFELEYSGASVADEQLPKVQEVVKKAAKHYHKQRAVLASALDIVGAENVVQAIDRCVDEAKVKQKGEVITISSPAPSPTGTLTRMLFVAGNELRDNDPPESSDGDP